jgi:hypothetical protein
MESILLSLFFDLSSCRAYTFGGPGPIPHTVLWQAQDRLGLPEAAVSTLRQLDNEYLRIANDKSKA